MLSTSHGLAKFFLGFFGKRWMTLTLSTLSCVMMRGMFRARHDFKIFKSIVKSITVFVMNDLVTMENSVKMLLYNMSVLKDFNTANADISVSSISQPSLALGPKVKPALAITEVPFGEERIGPVKFFTALMTGDLLAATIFPHLATARNRACSGFANSREPVRLKSFTAYRAVPKMKFSLAVSTTKFLSFCQGWLKFFFRTALNTFEEHGTKYTRICAEVKV